MNKLKQILEFIRALLGFLLNLKKKKTDEKNEKPPRPIPGKLPDDVPDDTPSDSIGIVSGRPRDNGPVGGPFRGGAGTVSYTHLRTSAFRIGLADQPLYRRFNHVELDGAVEGNEDATKLLKFKEAYVGDYLMDETNKNFMREDMDYLRCV